MMRKIGKIVIHCSAGSINSTAADIVYFHTGPKEKGCSGWTKPGYHFFVEKDGKVVQLVPVDEIANGVKNNNADAIHICYAGGVDQVTFKHPMDTRTQEQKSAMLALLKRLKATYNCPIYGHRDFAIKACPSFDAKTEYSAL